MQVSRNGHLGMWKLAAFGHGVGQWWRVPSQHLFLIGKCVYCLHMCISLELCMDGWMDESMVVWMHVNASIAGMDGAGGTSSTLAGGAQARTVEAS